MVGTVGLRFVFALSLLLVVGCTPSRDPQANRSTDIDAAAEAGRNNIANYASTIAGEGNASAMAPIPIASPAPVTPHEPGTPGGLPKGGVVAEGKIAPDSAQAAAQVVQHYYALLEAGKYHDARLLWEDDGQASGMSDTAFAASFAPYGEYHAQIGAPGAIDAGAGQRYVSVPVRIYGRLKAGAAPYHAGGDVTLHRVGDVDGATAEQKAWHISGIALKPSP